MPGQDSSARLKAFSSSSMAPTPPPLARRFSFSYRYYNNVMYKVILSFKSQVPGDNPETGLIKTKNRFYKLKCND